MCERKYWTPCTPCFSICPKNQPSYQFQVTMLKSSYMIRYWKWARWQQHTWRYWETSSRAGLSSCQNILFLTIRKRVGLSFYKANDFVRVLSLLLRSRAIAARPSGLTSYRYSLRFASFASSCKQSQLLRSRAIAARPSGLTSSCKQSLLTTLRFVRDPWKI